jgi:hypothetical protein
MTRPALTPWGEVIPLHRYLTDAERKFDSALRAERDRLSAAYDRRPDLHDALLHAELKRNSDWSWSSAFFGLLCGLAAGMLLTAGLAWIVGLFL